MSVYLFSAIEDGSSIAFDPDSDLLSFDSPEVSAADLTLAILPGGAGLLVTSPTTSFTLLGTSLADVGTANTLFADGSLLVIASHANPLSDTWQGSDHDDLLFSTALQPLVLASTYANGNPALDSHTPSLSADGRFLVFTSTASNLAGPAETFQDSDVFLKDLVTGGVTRVSLPQVSGADAFGDSFAGTVSADGRYVAFLSNLANLVSGDTNNSTDVFVKDLLTGSLVRASVSAVGTQANGASYGPLSLSADGRWVAFASGSSNLVPGDTNGDTDIFVKDLQTGSVAIASTSSTGQQTGSGAFTESPSISADGRYVLFQSQSPDLVAGDSGNTRDLFVKDLTTGELKAASVDSEGQFIESFVAGSALSADGRYVAFFSSGAMLHDGKDGYGSLYLRDMQSGSLTRIKGASEFDGQWDTGNPAISADGRFVAFTTHASFAAGDQDGGSRDVYVTDTRTGSIAWASSLTGIPSTQFFSPAISNDGHTLSFTSGTGVYVVSNPLDIRVLAGGAGDDQYVVSQTLDQVVEKFDQGIDTVSSYASYKLPFNVENLTLLGTSAINGTGNSLNNRLLGNSAANVLDGGTGNDTMTGGGGDDVYYANSAADTVIETAGNGIDTLVSTVTRTLMAYVENLTLGGTAAINGTGNALPNVIKGNSADNQLDGGLSVDTLSYVDSTGRVTVDLSLTTAQATTSAGNDTITNIENLTGSRFADLLSGNAGSNRLDGGAGADEMAGGEGDDIYRVDNAGDRVIERVGGGSDLVEATLSWSLGEQTENLTLLGTSAINGTGNELANRITGNNATNTLAGGAGDDTLNGGGSNDIMDGGTGNDTFIVNASYDRTIELAGGGHDIVLSSVGWTLAAEIEDLTLTGTSAANGTGNGLANRISGNDRNNVLDGRGGADTMTGGLGDDEYFVDDTGDQAIEQAGGGVDLVRASVSWTMSSGVEKLILSNGTGNINGTGSGGADQITGNSGLNVLDGGLGADTLTGGAGDDVYVVDNSGDKVVELNDTSDGTDTIRSSISLTLVSGVENLILTGGTALNATGNAWANRITGNGAANVLNGGGGTDTMAGGGGDDTYLVDSDEDLTVELPGGGTDLVQSSISWTLAADIENLQLTGSSWSNATGNTLANVMTGNSGNNVLNGGAGADVMKGGAGDDTYWVDQAGDQVSELAGGGIDTVNSAVSWTLGGEFENLVLTGTAAVNGTGNSKDNSLDGNSANNILNGGAGADFMEGGFGDDTYWTDNIGDVAWEQNDSGTDTIVSSVSWVLDDFLAVENLTLTGTAISGTGNFRANYITGNASNNVLDGAGGVDTLAGGAGNDTYIVGGSVNAVILEAAGGGTDTVESHNFTLTLANEVENLRLHSDAGSGSAIGNAIANQLTGNAFDNLLNGLAGADTMTGGAGNDRYVIDNTGDITLELVAGGYDAVESSISWALGSQIETLTLTGSTNTNGTGNLLDNRLTGNSGNNILNGSGGADTMVGGGGADTYWVDQLGDVIVEDTIGNPGLDTVNSSISWTLGDFLENLTLVGSAAVDATGNYSSNRLTGNIAANVLDGKEIGFDTFFGGGGSDIFVLGDRYDEDTIEDFATGVDKIRIKQGLVSVGDGDTLVEGSATVNGPGGFSNSAEFVVVTRNIVGEITLESAAAAIGSATGAYATFQTVLFMVDNGAHSELMLFRSSGPDGNVSASELTLLATLNGTASTITSDVIFGA